MQQYNWFDVWNSGVFTRRLLLKEQVLFTPFTQDKWHCNTVSDTVTLQFMDAQYFQ